MSRRRNDLPDQEEYGIEEIENGKLRTHCLNCEGRMRRIVAVNTRNLYAVCQTVGCPWYVDIARLETWVVEEAAIMPPIVPWEVPGGRYEGGHNFRHI